MNESDLTEGKTYRWAVLTEGGPNVGEPVVLEAYDPSLHLVMVKLWDGSKYGWTPAQNLSL